MLKMIYIFFIFFNLFLPNTVLSQQIILKDDNLENFDETLQETKDSKKLKQAQKLSSYMIQLKKENVLTLVDFVNFYNAIQQDIIFNPLKPCRNENSKKDNCKPTSFAQSIHFEELEKFLKNSDQIDLDYLQELLADHIKETEYVAEEKEKNKDREKLIDKILFHKIEPSDYIIMGVSEKIEDKELLKILKDKGMTEPYRLARLKLSEGFELADILLPQSIYAIVMEENPNYSGINNIFDKISDSRFSEISVNNKKIKVAHGSAVLNIQEKDVTNFLKKINDKDFQKKNEIISKISKNGKCKFDIITEDQFDFLRYHLFLKSAIFYNDDEANDVKNGVNIDNIYTNNRYTYYQVIRNKNSTLRDKSGKVKETIILRPFGDDKYSEGKLYSLSSNSNLKQIKSVKIPIPENSTLAHQKTIALQKGSRINYRSSKKIGDHEFFSLADHNNFYIRPRSNTSNLISANLSLNYSDQFGFDMSMSQLLFGLNFVNNHLYYSKFRDDTVGRFEIQSKDLKENKNPNNDYSNVFENITDFERKSKIDFSNLKSNKNNSQNYRLNGILLTRKCQ